MSGVNSFEDSQVTCAANRLAADGCYVFLPVDGALLRRCIHQLCPTSRLYLTIRFDGNQFAHDRRVGRHSAFQAQLEGIRVAQLSGFLTCAHLILHADSNPDEFAGLHSQLRKLSLDGFLISPAASGAGLERRVSDARRQSLSRPWVLLSRLLDSAVLPETSATASPERSQAPDRLIVELQPATCEEGAQTP
jgi:hypothetical protein